MSVAKPVRLLNIRKGNTGSAGLFSYTPNTTSTKSPIIKGTIVLHDDQGYNAPAQLRGNEKAVHPTVNSRIPHQSSLDS